MKVNRLVLAAALCGSASAQTEVLMNGSAVQNGVAFSYETRLEPPTPPFAGGFVGGAVTDGGGIHRYLAYNSVHKFFGYDLQVSYEEPTNSYLVTLRPLSIDPARVELPNSASWTVVPIPTYPSPQNVHGGDRIALDIFVNPATGQKIVDYLSFPKPRMKSRAYQIGSSDQLYVNVLHHGELSGEVTVRADGFIALRGTAGEVKAAGLTPPELTNAIADRYAKYVDHPEVDVQVARFLTNTDRKFSITGDIRRPGTYVLSVPKTVSEAILEAGGPTDFAKVNRCYILRGQEKLPFNYNDLRKGKNLAQNVILQSGDVIVVP
jgi:polysaccharide export outer membrane protein